MLSLIPATLWALPLKIYPESDFLSLHSYSLTNRAVLLSEMSWFEQWITAALMQGLPGSCFPFPSQSYLLTSSIIFTGLTPSSQVGIFADLWLARQLLLQAFILVTPFVWNALLPEIHMASSSLLSSLY